MNGLLGVIYYFLLTVCKNRVNLRKRTYIFTSLQIFLNDFFEKLAYIKPNTAMACSGWEID